MPARPSAIRARLSAPTRDQEDLLSAWRTVALETMPYMASLLFLLRPVNARGLETFGVDPSMRLYVDFECVAEEMDAIAGGEALLHECSHILQEHFALPGEIPDADADLLNEAADLAINDDLVSAGCEWIARNGLTPDSMGLPDGLTPHDYYRRLAQQAHERAGALGAPMAGAGAGDDDDAPDSEYGCGAGAGAPGGYELAPDEDLGGAAPPVSPDQLTGAILDVAIDAREYAKSAGSLPGGVQELVDAAFAPPSIPWQQTLGAELRRVGAHRRGQVDTSHAKRSRRRRPLLHRADGTLARILYPGDIEPDPRIAVIRDTSASTQAELSPISREIEGIASRAGIRGSRLMVYDADTVVHTATPYRTSRDLAHVTGRGGTRIGSVITGLSRQHTSTPPSRGCRPDLIVALTDAETNDWPPHSLGVPVVVGIVGERNWHNAETIPGWIRIVRIPLEGSADLRQSR